MNMSRPLLSLSLFHTLPYTHVPVPVLEIYYILTGHFPEFLLDIYRTFSNQLVGRTT